MKNIKFTPKQCLNSLLLISPLMAASAVNAAVTLESTTKITDNALHFNGNDIDSSTFKNKNLTIQEQQDDSLYHYKFGGSISAHGDSVKTYKHYVFMTWYRGDKYDRHVMLSRLNTKTKVVKTIEFPHRHTGYQGNWWVGESHNTIGLAVSPKNGTIHMVYDMHAYTDTNLGGKFKDDYFRYSYSVAGAAEVADDDFTLENLFVKDTSEISQGPDDYKHLVMTKNLDDRLNFSSFTYPKFFDTKEGDLMHFMRWGGNNNGAYYYNRYDATAEKWSKFVPFNHKNQKSHGVDYDWGLYGEMKYVNGKLRVGFQRRSSNNSDKYTYQNGIYYAYLDDPENNVWKDHTGKPITWPLVDADEIKIFEPGDLVETTSNAANGSGTPPGKVYIVGNFDWTVTDKGDIHFIHKVVDKEFNKTVYGHLYKPAGATEFIHAPGITGASEINAIGDDVYIIGLKNNRPYVEVAKGGTTEFKEIYRDTTTTTSFQHGVSYAKNGKVYYYLMEEASGTARPLHLQVIDLGLPKTTVTFEQDELSLFAGYQSLNITATPVIADSNRSIASVDLYIDDELVSTQGSAASYTWSQADAKLQNLVAGTYSIKAVVTDDLGNQEEALMTLMVKQPTPPVVAFTNSTLEVVEGYTGLSVAVTASSPDSREITGVKLYIGETLIGEDTAAPYQWTDAGLLGLAAGSHTVKAVVTDSADLTSEATATITVKEPLPPQVAFAQNSISKTEGYSSISVTVNATSPDGNTITEVKLYLNDVEVAEKTSAPFTFTQSTSALAGLAPGSYTLKAVATDDRGLSSETTASVTVAAKPKEPESSGGGGGSTGLFWLACVSLLAMGRRTKS